KRPCYVAGVQEQQLGRLASTRDPTMWKSLGLTHSRVAHPCVAQRWTIADLVDESGHFPFRTGGALHSFSLRASDDLSDPLEASTGSAIARKDIARRGGNRCRRRIRIGSGIQSRSKARVRRTSGTIPQRSPEFAGQEGA